MCEVCELEVKIEDFLRSEYPFLKKWSFSEKELVASFKKKVEEVLGEDIKERDEYGFESVV
jgi:hypothetical protein